MQYPFKNNNLPIFTLYLILIVIYFFLKVLLNKTEFLAFKIVFLNSFSTFCNMESQPSLILNDRSRYVVPVLDYKLCHHTSFCLTHHQTDKDAKSISRYLLHFSAFAYLFSAHTVRSLICSVVVFLCPCFFKGCANYRPWQ